MDVFKADDGGCGVGARLLAWDAYEDKPLTDGDRGTSAAFKAAAELPYNKLTKFKLCTDELEDSSASFMATDVGLIGVFDRFAWNQKVNKL